MNSSSLAPVPSAPTRGIHRGKAGALAGLVLAVISLWVLGSNWKEAEGLVAASYDSALQISVPFAEDPQQTNVIVVYIDMFSHVELGQNPTKPWDRNLHARLVRRLTRAGARAVVFDVIFDTPRADSMEARKEDEAFAAAIRENGRVILASEFSRSDHNTGVGARLETRQVIEPIELFRKDAAGVGMAELATGRDFTVRFGFDGDLEGGNPSLTRATLEFLGRISTNEPARANWLRYYGPPMSIKSVSYATALNASPELDAQFRNRVVFVGARPFAGLYGERRDELRCPLVPSSGRQSFMPAVEVHATQLLNGMRYEGLKRWPLSVERWVFGVGGFLLGLGLLRLKLSWAFAASAGCAAMVLAAVPFGILAWDFWFPWLIPVAVQLPGAVLVTVVVESTDWFLHRRRHELFRRQAEVRLKEQAALLDKAQDAIVVQDLQGKTLYANPGATRLYGWTLESLERDGLPTDAVSVSETIRSQALAQTMDSGEWVGELEQLTRSGQRIYVQSRWTLIRDETGRPNSLLMINTDHTEKKRLEARFLQAQRMEAVGAIAGGMAHDLNNALAPVLLGLEMLRRQPQSEDTDQMLDAMQSNARRGTDMVRQVLLFARGEEGATELVNVRQLIRETERMLRPMIPRTIAVSTLVPGDIWPVRGNSTRLYQVLVNLCLNARDAMPSGGTLTLAVDNVEMDAEEAAAIRGASVGSYVAFTVADTGIGIAPENLEKVFEPFFTTKAADKGTGLGLTTVSHIVRAASGFIHVESELGVGTTFQVFLPKADTSNQTEMMRAIGDPRPCVVVVDDEHALHSLYSTTLEAHGFRTVVVPDMLEALEQIRRIGPARLVAVIIDGELPGSDSQQLLQAIRHQNASVRIVWVRGPSAASPEAESVVVLQRPVLAEALVAAVVSKT